MAGWEAPGWTAPPPSGRTATRATTGAGTDAARPRRSPPRAARPAFATRAAASPDAAAAFLAAAGVPAADVAAMKAKAPDALKASVDGVLKPKVALLQGAAGLTGAQLGRVLAAQPRLLTLSLERHLAPTVHYYRSALGLRARTLARVAAERPILLTYDVADVIQPKAAFFEGIGIGAPGLKRMLTKSPDILSIGVGNDLKPTVEYLQTGLGVKGKELADLLTHHPTIFHCPLAVAKENAKELAAMGLDAAGVRAVLTGAPVLFRRSLKSKSMAAKLKFWAATGRAPADLAASPSFLARSIKRSGPRLEFAAKAGGGGKGVAALLAGPDAAFAADALGRPGAAAEFLAFAKGWPAANAAKYGFKA